MFNHFLHEITRLSIYSQLLIQSIIATKEEGLLFVVSKQTQNHFSISNQIISLLYLKTPAQLTELALLYESHRKWYHTCGPSTNTKKLFVIYLGEREPIGGHTKRVWKHRNMTWILTAFPLSGIRGLTIGNMWTLPDFIFSGNKLRGKWNVANL